MFVFRLAEEHEEKVLTKEKEKCADKLEEMYAELQCDFVANMLYVTCKERRRSQCEKKIMEEKHTAIIEALEDTIRVRS